MEHLGVKKPYSLQGLKEGGTGAFAEIRDECFTWSMAGRKL